MQVHAASAHERNATRIPSRGSPAGRRPRRVHTRAFKGLDDEGEDDAPAAAPQAGGWAGRYSRVMLKLSGEALEGDQKFGIDPAVLRKVAREVAAASRQGVQIAIVVGGGNFFRGGDRWPGLERTTADHVGMLATVMNGLSLQSALENEGIQVRPCHPFTQPTGALVAAAARSKSTQVRSPFCSPRQRSR